MSPRAEWRLGFTKAYDYVTGKTDWFAAGLPREGKLVSIPRASTGAANMVTPMVKEVTGPEPRSFDQFARDYAGAFKGE